MTDIVDRLGRTIAIVTGIIAATVSANTLLTTCSKQETERYAAFRTAALSEENYWKSLYDDYLTVFGDEFANRQDRKRAKILALYTISQRKLPDFVEFDVPDAEKAQAVERLTVMQAGLLNGLEEQGSTDPILKELLARRSFAGKVQTRAAATEPPPAPPPPPVPAKEGAPPAAPEATILTLSPNSPTGWDVDLFWCQGAGEGANYEVARTLGDGFATLAKTGRSIAPGVTVGRVRVRPASPGFQQLPNSPARATWVVYDTGPGEVEAATALQQALNAATNRARFGLVGSGGRRTRWYLSAFVCPAAASNSPAVAQRS